MNLPDERVERLQTMPFFGGMRAQAIQVLLDGAAIVQLPAGSCFFRDGDRGDSMFVLESGRAAVLKSWRGQEHQILELGVGDCFGEMSLMDLGPRSATVRAMQDCRAMEIDANHLLRLLQLDVEQFALIQMNMGREVCRRLRAMDELLIRLGKPLRP